MALVWRRSTSRRTLCAHETGTQSECEQPWHESGRKPTKIKVRALKALTSFDLTPERRTGENIGMLWWLPRSASKVLYLRPVKKRTESPSELPGLLCQLWRAVSPAEQTCEDKISLACRALNDRLTVLSGARSNATLPHYRGRHCGREKDYA